MSEAFCAAEGDGVALYDIDGQMPFDGWHGSMKPEGRRAILFVGPAHDDPHFTSR